MAHLACVWVKVTTISPVAPVGTLTIYMAIIEAPLVELILLTTSVGVRPAIVIEEMSTEELPPLPCTTTMTYLSLAIVPRF